MWIGSLLWVAVAFIAWIEKFKSKKETHLWPQIVITSIATAPVTGIYPPLFLYQETQDSCG